MISIVTFGNAFDGIRIFGPFDDEDAAVVYASNSGEDEWNVVSVHDPVDANEGWQDRLDRCEADPVFDALEDVGVTMTQFVIDLHNGDKTAHRFLDKLATKLEGESDA